MPGPSVPKSREPRDEHDSRPSHHHGGVPDFPAVADLLARQHELQDQYRDRHHDDAVAAPADAGELQAHLHRRELVFRLHQLADLCADQHRDLDFGGVAGGLRLLALPFSWRQASVLLAVVEPYGAGGGVCAAVLQSLFGDQSVRHAVGGCAGALHLQCAAGGLDPRRFRLRRTARDRRDRVPRRLFVPALLRQDPGAVDRERHRRRSVLLFHVLLGRIAAGAHVDVGQRQADLGHHDAHGLGLRYGLGPAGRGRRAHHHPRRPGDLVRPQLHRARFRAGTGVAMEHIAWMAWTLPTAIFFVMLALTLGAMTWLAVAYPEAERVGVLRIPTTRGDRLFISLVLAAVIHLLWIAFVGTDPLVTLPIGEGVEISSLWLATVISLVSAVAIFRSV